MDRAQRASLPCVLLANWQSPPPDMFGGNPRGGLSCGSYDFHHTCAKSPERSSLPILPTTPLPPVREYCDCSRSDGLTSCQTHQISGQLSAFVS